MAEIMNEERVMLREIVLGHDGFKCICVVRMNNSRENFFVEVNRRVEWWSVDDRGREVCVVQKGLCFGSQEIFKRGGLGPCTSKRRRDEIFRRKSRCGRGRLSCEYIQRDRLL